VVLLMSFVTLTMFWNMMLFVLVFFLVFSMPVMLFLSILCVVMFV